MVLLAAGLGAATAVAVVSAAAAPSPRAKLAGSVPPWATSANFKGATTATDPVGFRIYLGWRNGAQAEALAQSVSDPSSASYRHFVSAAKFRQQFSPSQSDVNAVKGWLTSQGFTVDFTPSNNLYVAAEGTVAQAQTAFAVPFGEYSVDGLTLRAPQMDVSVPASLAGVVESVVGLDQSSQLVHYDHVGGPDASPSPGFRVAPPCSAFWGEKLASDLPAYKGQTYPYAPCGYSPAQLRGAYGVTGSDLDGSGQTVAVIDAYASPTILQDVNTYSSRHGLPQFGGNQFSQVVAPGTFRHPEAGRRPDPQGWYGEETLDIEAVHSMAPGANVVFVGAPNNLQDLDAALNHVVDRQLAQIVTNSYGWNGEALPHGFVKPVEDILVQAAAEGIGVYFSSGDNGDEVDTTGLRMADFPASSPWVTAVGGTSLGVGATNDYVFEAGWGTTKSVLSGTTWGSPVWIYGAGGGTSRLFAEPGYQTGVVPASISNVYGPAARAVPDVAMDADPGTGMLVGQTQQFSDCTGGAASCYDEYRIGGTSLASPLFAGVMALADQAAGTPHGFANPALYAQAGTTAYRDVTSPAKTMAVVRVDYANTVNAADGITESIRFINQTESLQTTAGYDDVTGNGTPNGAAFFSALGK